MTADEFAADLKKTRAILEDIGGAEVRGYRAPSFSVDTRTPWAHAVLAEQGYAYSSSVAPVVHDHYGWPQSPRHAWRSEEHTSELQSLMRISYAVLCLKKKKPPLIKPTHYDTN